MRQAHTDMLMKMSGQPLREAESRHRMPNNCSARTEELAKHKEPRPMKDRTKHTDFRGLVHADCEHALEALYPGFGHELSTSFRERATKSCEPGWPPPPRAETPVRTRRRVDEEAKAECLFQYGNPSSQTRSDSLPTLHRRDPNTLMNYSKAQFKSNAAPPPPDQIETLLNEDASPATSLRDPNRLTASNFSRTKHYKQPTKAAKSTTPMAQALGDV